MHKHCNLNKWEIWDYTIPQITELVKSTNKYLEFEIRMNSLPLDVFGALTGGEVDNKVVSATEDGYKVATADDIDLLEQFLGGGL